MDESIESDIPLLGDVVGSVRVGASWPRQQRSIPELCHARTFEIRLHQIGFDGPYLMRELIYQRDEIGRGLVAMEAMGIPLIGFSMFNYGWRVLATEFNVEPLIHKTIDVFQLLWEAVDAGASEDGGARREGALALENLVATNVNGSEAPNAHELIQLWWALINRGEADVGGETIAFPPGVQDKLEGQMRTFNSREWASKILENGSSTNYPMRHFAQMRNLLIRTYRIYLR